MTTGVSDAAPVSIDSANQLGKVTSIPGTLITGPITAAGATFQSTYVGAGAGASVTGGEQNVAFGEDALKNSTLGGANVAIGPLALFGNVNGIFNIAIGRAALAGNSGSSNIGIGDNGGSNLTTGEFNIAIGSMRCRGVEDDPRRQCQLRTIQRRLHPGHPYRNGRRRGPGRLCGLLGETGHGSLVAPVQG